MPEKVKAMRNVLVSLRTYGCIRNQRSDRLPLTYLILPLFSLIYANFTTLRFICTIKIVKLNNYLKVVITVIFAAIKKLL